MPSVSSFGSPLPLKLHPLDKKLPPLTQGSGQNEDGEIATLTMTGEENMISLLQFCQGHVQEHSDNLYEI